MFVDPLAVALAALALVVPPVRSRLFSFLPENTKRRRLFKNHIVPEYKRASQKVASMCHAKLKLAYDRFEEFVDLMSCIDCDIHDEKSLNELFAKGREQIKEAAPLLRSAYKGAFSAAADLENFKDHERLQAYNLAFSCQLYLYFDDLQMVEKSFNRLLEHLYSDQHLKGHIKKYLQEKDGYTLKNFSKVAICSYSRKAIYAIQNIANHLKEIVHEICMEKDSAMEKRLLDAITKPVDLNRKYHRFFTCNWQADEIHKVEQQILSMAGSICSELQITPKNILTPETCIRGVADSNLFCLNENKSRAIIYDSQNGKIIRISLTSETSDDQSRSEANFDWPKFISGPAKCVGFRLRASESDANKDSLLALVWEQVSTRKRKIYLLSIELNDKLAILGRHHVLAEDFYGTDSSVEPHLIQGGNGQIWCVVIQKFGAKSTGIKAYKVEYNGRCECQPQILVDGQWSHPFFANDSLYVLPNYTGGASKCDKMLTAKLDGKQKSEVVTLASSTRDFPSFNDSIWSEPCVSGDTFVAVYIFKQKEHTGAVWILNCKEIMWTTCFEFEGTCHAICNRMSLNFSDDSKLILHGECTVEFCADRAHIFMLDIGSSAVNGTVQLSTTGSNNQSVASDMTSDCLQTDQGDLMWFTDGFQKSNFSPVESMNFQRGDASVVVLGGNLYVVGGMDDTTTLNSCERFDSLLNEWKFVACMRNRRHGAGVTTLDGFLYAVGGFDGNMPLNSCERYCPKEDVWTHLPPMSFPRGGVSAVAMFGRVYAVGGYDGTRYLDSVETYDPFTNQWTSTLASNQ